MAYAWRNQYEQDIREVDANTAELIHASGTAARYTQLDANGSYTAPIGARNSLAKNPDGTWTESRPSGFAARYRTDGKLSRLASLAGQVWTMAYESNPPGSGFVSPRLCAVDDLSGRRTTFAYVDSGRIRRIVDVAGRVTTYGRNRGREKQGETGDSHLFSVDDGLVETDNRVMPRVARIVIPGCPHHVTQRGNNRQDVFFVDDDRWTYLRLLHEESHKHGVVVAGGIPGTNSGNTILNSAVCEI